VTIFIPIFPFLINKLMRFSNVIVTSFGNYTCLKITNQSMQINLLCAKRYATASGG